MRVEVFSYAIGHHNRVSHLISQCFVEIAGVSYVVKARLLIVQESGVNSSRRIDLDRVSWRPTVETG